MSLSSVSIDQVLDVWADLEDALAGRNGFGGDTAEIYRLLPNHPTPPRPEDYARANAALGELLQRFSSMRGCQVYLGATRRHAGVPLDDALPDFSNTVHGTQCRCHDRDPDQDHHHHPDPPRREVRVQHDHG